MASVFGGMCSPITWVSSVGEFMLKCVDGGRYMELRLELVGSLGLFSPGAALVTAWQGVVMFAIRFSAI